jgi:hypothetical protein
MDTQTWVGFFVLGSLAYIVLVQASRSRVAAVTGVVAVAAILSSMAHFLEWSGSGLENTLVHAGFVGVVATLSHACFQARPSKWWALVFVACALTRFEAIVHVVPLLALMVVLHMMRYRNLASLRVAGLAAGIYAAVYLARTAYFADLAPNSAYAQQIHPIESLLTLLQGKASPDVTKHALEIIAANSGSDSACCGRRARVHRVVGAISPARQHRRGDRGDGDGARPGVW